MIFPFYETDQNPKTLISHYDPLVLGSNTTINYAEVSLLYKNSYNNISSLKVTIRDTSFAKATNILGFQGIDCDDNCGNLDSGFKVEYNNTNNSTENILAAENIMFFMDFTFEFSDNNKTFYSDYTINMNDSDFTPMKRSDVDCTKKFSSEIILPLKDEDGNFIQSNSKTYTGHAEVRMIHLDSLDIVFIACGLD